MPESLGDLPVGLGVPFADLEMVKITKPLIRLLIDAIAEKTPAKANHVKRYLSLAFAWGSERGYCVGKRASLAENDPDFAAAIAAAPAVMSGVPDFTHERCVSMTQQRKEPVTFGELADYMQMRDTLNDLGNSMLTVVREMMAPGITATRVDASDPAGMGTPQVG